MYMQFFIYFLSYFPGAMVVYCGYADESGVSALRADPLDVKDVHDAEPHIDRGVATRVKGLPRQTG